MHHLETAAREVAERLETVLREAEMTWDTLQPRFLILQALVVGYRRAVTNFTSAEDTLNWVRRSKSERVAAMERAFLTASFRLGRATAHGEDALEMLETGGMLSLALLDDAGQRNVMSRLDGIALASKIACKAAKQAELRRTARTRQASRKLRKRLKKLT